MVPFLGLEKLFANQYGPNQNKAGKDKDVEPECLARANTSYKTDATSDQYIDYDHGQGHQHDTQTYSIAIFSGFYISNVIITTIIIAGNYFIIFPYIQVLPQKFMLCTLCSSLIEKPWI